MAEVLDRRQPASKEDFRFVWLPSSPSGPYGEGPDLRPAHTLVPEGTWTAALDAFLVRLVEKYSTFAPSIFTALAGDSFPWLPKVAANCPPILWSIHNRFAPDDWIGPVAALAYSRMMSLVEWSPLPEMQCPLCGETFDARGLHPRWHVIAYGPPRWCTRCAGAGWGTEPATRDESLNAVRHYANIYGTPPPNKWYRSIIPPGLPDVQRDEMLASRMAMPYFETLKENGLRPWTAVLAEAGVLDGGNFRAGRGVMSHAADGHWCRSLMERTVDDFFASNGIEHEPEPNWPQHPLHNANGRKRADWRLDDGTMVEAAGLLSDDGYASRMEIKRQLAQELEIPLIVLEPTDLLRLELVFSKWSRVGSALRDG